MKLWFLTIDVGNAALAAIIRAVVGAPYHRAEMSVDSHGGIVTYTGSRSGAPQCYRIQVQPGDKIAPSDLEIWLTSRWRAYTAHLGRLLVTPVEHEPWPLRQATLTVNEQNLTDSVGLHGLSDPPLDADVHLRRRVCSGPGPWAGRDSRVGQGGRRTQYPVPPGLAPGLPRLLGASGPHGEVGLAWVVWCRTEARPTQQPELFVRSRN